MVMVVMMMLVMVVKARSALVCGASSAKGKVAQCCWLSGSSLPLPNTLYGDEVGTPLSLLWDKVERERERERERKKERGRERETQPRKSSAAVLCPALLMMNPCISPSPVYI